MADHPLRQDIIDELDYEPGLDARHVAVSVDDGTATLSGFVRSYAEKCTAEADVKRMKGGLAHDTGRRCSKQGSAGGCGPQVRR